MFSSDQIKVFHAAFNEVSRVETERWMGEEGKEVENVKLYKLLWSKNAVKAPVTSLP